MICYIVTETADKYRDMDCHRIKHTLERCSADVCLVLHYTQVTRALLEELRPVALCHSGGVTPHAQYDILQRPDYRWAIMQSGIPQIGFCGGHQLIGEMYGAQVQPMRELRADEPDLCPDYHPGWFKEWGVYPVRIVATDPILAGFDQIIRVRQAHRSHLTTLPDGFRLLASTDECPVQAMVHEGQLIYGTQFHPETASEDYPDGWRLLENFFALARGRQRG